MKAAQIQAKIYSGYGKAAARLGYDTQVFRASGPLEPVVDANLIATLPASFNAEDMHYRKPNGYGHPLWFCMADGRQLQVGDVLKNSEDGTFFIAAMQSLLPILTVQTNTTVSILRLPENTAVGAIGYGGATAATEQALISGWPASLLIGGRGEKNQVDLPADTRAGHYALLLPNPGVTLRTSDIVVDHLGRRFALQSCELTDLGWRMTARQELA